VISKLSKHLKIFGRRLNQNRELKALARVDNHTLKTVLNAFYNTHANSTSPSEIQAFKRCEVYRQQLLKDDTLINYQIFSSDKTTKVREICKKAPSSPKWCQFLFHLVKSTEAKEILEIGTNLGISGSYMLEAIKNSGGYFTTMEGLPQLCEISTNQFSSIVPNSKFKVIQGLYDDTFPALIKEGKGFDLIFIDGNHKKEPTLEYFNALKALSGACTVYVFDDIYWSEEMTDAWEEIKIDPEVNFTLDLYMMGIAVIDKNETLRNQNFNLHLAY
jgi:predicted O-methyltransferase YrrM